MSPRDRTREKPLPPKKSRGKDEVDLTSVRGFRAAYVALLASLALLFLLAFALLSDQVTSMDSNAAVINLAGRQRMLISRTALLAQMLDATSEPERRAPIQEELVATTALLERSHIALSEGRKRWDIPAPAVDVQRLYFGGEDSLNAQIEAFLHRARRLSTSVPTSETWVEDLALVTGAALGGLLHRVDEAVSLYQEHNDVAMRKLLSHFTWTSLGFSAVILASAVLVFYPMERRILAQMTDLNRLRMTQLERSEMRLELLLENAPAVLWSADPQGKITSLSAPECNDQTMPCSAGCLPNECPLQEHCYDIATGRGGVADEPENRIHTFVFRCKQRSFHAALATVTEAERRHTIGVALDVSEMEDVNQELQAAREIQEELFPKNHPQIDGVEVLARTVPASAAAGDYYDTLRLDDSCLGVIVGDVSGHGIGPALLMAETRAYLRSLARTETDLAEILRRTSAVLNADTQKNRFVTLFFGVLDPADRSLTYCSAGHECGYIIDADGLVKSKLPSTGLPLGILPGNRYEVVHVEDLNIGDTLFLFTDGVCEANNSRGEEYGIHRALSLLGRHHHQPPGAVLEALQRNIKEFAGDQVQADDITIMLARFVEPEGMHQVA